MFAIELVLVFSPNGKKLAIPKVNGAISLMDLDSNLLFEFKAHQGEVNQIAFTPNGNQLVSTGKDNTARLWDLREKQLAEAKIKTEQIDRIKFSKKKEYNPYTERLDQFSRSINVQESDRHLCDDVKK